MKNVNQNNTQQPNISTISTAGNYIVQSSNNAFGDSAFMVHNKIKRTGFMFDCGSLSFMSRELSGIEDIFISHTHMDHFFGFDKLLRTAIINELSINIYGGEGIIRNVHGKIQGYTWNLIEDYNVSITVYELPDVAYLDGETFIDGVRFTSLNSFIGENFTEKFSIVSDLGDGFTFDYEIFDHGIKSLGYRIFEPNRWKINKKLLDELGLKSDRWVGEYVKILTDTNGNIDKLRALPKIEVTYKDGSLELKGCDELIKLGDYHVGKSISYVTDIAPTKNNIDNIVEFLGKSEISLIEGVFKDEDIDEAIAKNHLCIGMAKDILRRSNSVYGYIFHHSSRYKVESNFFQDFVLNDRFDKPLIQNKQNILTKLNNSKKNSD